VSGAGMLNLPALYHQAGWFIMALGFCLICLIATTSATFLCDAIARIPGNQNFDKRIEFSTAFHHYYGHWGYLFSQIGLVLCLMSQALSSIIAVAPIMDQFIVFLFHKTFALDVSHSGFITWSDSVCDSINYVHNHPAGCVPFDGEGYVVTLGYIVTLAMIMPMGIMNLEDNIWIQYLSFLMLVVLMLEFFYHFIHMGLHPATVSVVGTDFSHVLGVIIFNFAFVVTIPSWVNEKKPGVSVNKAMWSSTISSCAGYILVGLLGSWAYAHVPANFLSALGSKLTPVVTRVCAYLFAIGIIGLGIPVFCIMTRYNLIVGKVCRPLWASFWGVAFPWLIGWIFYQGAGFAHVMNWTSLIVNGFINYVAPLMLSLKSIGVDAWDRDKNGRLRFFPRREGFEPEPSSVNPLPALLRPYQREIILVIIFLMFPLIIVSIVLAGIQAAHGNSE